ncbi:GNAT family N-acetyltransferase [Alteromonas sp. ALT199]|uniref:GNAT family N-acetyltransferase n=1 Tax=unclassified Alteromonas TaxID=2614992 RepID=UPI001BEAADE1|nr:GNAT family N-acetyltransferase [Alteromonas sp. ALT199]MBT3137290.1 GNAT family N-acetyltransferase [Alteromonas sp. ALT199]
MQFQLKKIKHKDVNEVASKAKTSNTPSPFLSLEYFSVLAEVPERHGEFIAIDCGTGEHAITYLGHSSTIKRLPFFQQSFLSQTGLRYYDQLWVEYNGWLGSSPNDNAIVETVLKYAFDRGDVRLTVSMTIDADLWTRAAKKLGASISTSQTVGYTKSLEGIETFEDVIATLSQNTRSRIRKSIRLLDAVQDDISLSVANSPEQILEYYNCLKRNHIQKWQNTVEGSGFQNSFFDSNLLRLLTHHPEFMKILKVQCRGNTLGYATYMLKNERAYFYCSGINTSLAEGKVKPGYILHCKAIAHFAKKGFKLYDFMGGDAQYKRSLSDNSVVFHSVEVISPNIKGKVFTMTQKIKELLSF